MHVEVSVALNFVISYLYNKLPRRRVDMFGEEMERGLKKKFEGHWYGDKPFKGSAYRCIRVSADRVEPVIELSALTSRLDIDEIREYLPKDLTIWIDPGDVSYRIGEKGIVKVLYSSRQTNDGLHNVDREIAAASRGFNPDAQCFKPIDSLSSSLSNLSVSPGSTSPSGLGSSTVNNGSLTPGGATSPWAAGSMSPIGPNYESTSPTSGPAGSPGAAPAQHTNGNQTPAATPMTSFLNRNNQNNTMTTAMFAQTKFGSTKLKTQAKRPNRLSPTEVGAYFKQRHSPLGSPSNGLPPPPPQGMGSPFGGPMGHPSSLSPRGNGNRGRMMPPYGMDMNQGRGGLSPFYLMPQQAPNHTAPPPNLQTGGGGLSDLYNPMGLPGPFAQPPPPGPAVSSAYNNQGLNIPRFHDVFPMGSSSSSAGQSSSGSTGTPSTPGSNMSSTPSPDSGLSHKTFMEGLNYNYNNLPSYQTLQHLLVAN